MKLSSHIFKLTAFRIGMLATLCSLFFSFIEVGFLTQLEGDLYDLRLKAYKHARPAGEVVIVAIDEKSVDALGRWPWPRTVIAEIIDQLTGYGAKVIGFDIVFSEPDENNILQEIKALKSEISSWQIADDRLNSYLEALEQKADTDRILAEAIERSDRVLLGFFFHTDANEAKHISRQRQNENFDNIAGSAYAVKFFSPQAENVAFEQAYAAEANLKIFCDTAKGSGYFNIFPDSDGVVRRVPLITAFRDEFFPPLPLRMLRFYFDEEPLLKIEESGVRSVWIGDIEIPTDEHGFMLINFRGKGRTFPYYSCADVLDGKIDSQLFQDKIVLIGGTAKGLTDFRSIPLAGVFPGPEVHANIIDNILQEDFLRRPHWFKGIEYAIIITLGLLFSLVLPRVRAVYGFLGALVFIMLYVFLDQYFFQNLRVWLNIVYPIVTIVFIYTGTTLYRYITEEREKAHIRDTFSVYVPPAVVNEMIKHPEKLRLGGEKKKLTVLFSDIRGFTTISESLSPDELVKLMNDYFTAMTHIVFKYEGTLDKYIGDALMAVFGAPIEQEDHAMRCCAAALDMVDELRDLREQWSADGTPPFDVAVGINTGIMAVGNMGSDLRFDYTVMGDAVNLGSRLEGLNKTYGTRIIISEYTYAHVKDWLFCRELDYVRVKGKRHRLTIYELIGRDDVPAAMHKAVRYFHQGLSFYRSRDWDRAESCFQRALAKKPGDRPSRLYLQRCAVCRKTELPEDWDGVFLSTENQLP